MKIKGRIIEIIKPEEHEKYMTPNVFRDKESPFYNKFLVRITTTNIPLKTFQSFFKNLIWKIKDKENKGKMNYIVGMENCPYKLEDEVEIEIERYYKPTDLFLESKDTYDAKEHEGYYP